MAIDHTRAYQLRVSLVPLEQYRRRRTHHDDGRGGRGGPSAMEGVEGMSGGDSSGSGVGVEGLALLMIRRGVSLLLGRWSWEAHEARRRAEIKKMVIEDGESMVERY